ncbi:hypothetical protein KL942_004262 [Ogataea angusta]|uniref:Spindle pole body component n=1 Tax=Pichia angusta TaxID=870730 RepID=A0ABQ7RTE1_PICAN|nr:hypothetical protein KL942_004262 [Ogataea angusta]KAG7847299.1 hypothetical protein KL940_004045 [Ogataea angusta]KAG7856078.1 hypothetical protein KL919_004471 [Ogataea angusta]
MSFDTLRLSSTPHLVGRCLRFPPTFADSGGLPRPKRFPVDQMQSFRDQEAAVFQDLLFVLIGLEGFYIRYADSFSIDDSPLQRLIGPDFSINKHLDSGLKDIAKRISRLGKYYVSLVSFVEQYDDLEYGTVVQALCYEVREVLRVYESILVQIEHEFHHNANYSVTLLEQDLTVNTTLQLTHLYELVIQIVQENENRKDSSNMNKMRFESMLKSLKDDHYTGTLDGVTSDPTNSKVVKGGLVLSFIQSGIDKHKGDAASYQFMVDLFNKVSVGYVFMLNWWLETGTIEDPYEEFLIHQNLEGSRVSEDYWADKFTIRSEGLLRQFYPPNVQKKVILTGKYLNVLKECGVDVDNLGSIEHIRTLQDNDLFIRLDEAYTRANKLIIDLLFNGYHIREFLESLNKYFLLTNNSSFNDFITDSLSELRKSKEHASINTLTKLYLSSYHKDDMIDDHPSAKSRRLIFNLATLSLTKYTLLDELVMILSAKTTNSEKVFASSDLNSLKNLLNSTLEANENNAKTSVLTNTKIDQYAVFSFCLDLEVPFPLNLIITKSQMVEYQFIFRNLSYLKFVEKCLEISWREITHQRFWKWQFRDERLRRWIKRARVVHAKMRTFVNLCLFYLNYDVMHANWKKVESVLESLKTDSSVELETVFSSIKSFLSTILSESMLTKIRLAQIVNQLFAIIVLYHNFVMALRKTLILMDEDLFTENQSKLSPGTTFDPEKNNTRMRRLIAGLKNYEEKYYSKMSDMMDALKYYGEIDSPSLLRLYEELALSFNMEVY